jgi:8-hydroxy-5-deazaflavin:NADPH oxidoreductase
LDKTHHTLAILGGTGHEGSGLALRWARAGHRVIIGSRSLEKAVAAAREMQELLGISSITGDTNQNAAATADVVILTVPYAAQRSTVDDVKQELQGKILIDATVPLVPPKVGQVSIPQGGSAVAEIQRQLGESVRVVSAFQNVSAHRLHELDSDVHCDVLVCGNDVSARETVIGLAENIGLRAFHAGPIVNSIVAEALTSVLIAINSRYKSPGSGIRITGVPGNKEVS